MTKKRKRKLINFLKLISVLYFFTCVGLYFFQEKLIFFPEKLNNNYEFKFDQNFVELYFNTKDGNFLNGLLFKSVKAKGLVFYLHGNAGALDSWGSIAKVYTDLNYDIFILDYRGYGKSEGEIINQQQLFEDNQLVYNTLKKEYSEENIIILGYSIGTGLASKLASNNNAQHLILQAPYYNLIDIVKQNFSYIPSFILKYKFMTNEYLKKCKMPITIFHGDSDTVISYESSLKLKEEFKDRIHLITLKNQGHNGITYNKVYNKELITILTK